MTSVTRFPPAPGSRTPPLSIAARHGSLLFVSGTPGYHDDGSIDVDDFPAQFDQVVVKLRETLALGGSSMPNIIKVDVLLTRASDVAEMNVRYAAAFGSAPYPARTTCVVAALPDPRMLIEIECVAAVDESGA